MLHIGRYDGDDLGISVKFDIVRSRRHDGNVVVVIVRVRRLEGAVRAAVVTEVVGSKFLAALFRRALCERLDDDLVAGGKFDAVKGIDVVPRGGKLVVGIVERLVPGKPAEAAVEIIVRLYKRCILIERRAECFAVCIVGEGVFARRVDGHVIARSRKERSALFVEVGHIDVRRADGAFPRLTVDVQAREHDLVARFQIDGERIGGADARHLRSGIIQIAPLRDILPLDVELGHGGGKLCGRSVVFVSNGIEIADGDKPVIDVVVIVVLVGIGRQREGVVPGVFDDDIALLVGSLADPAAAREGRHFLAVHRHGAVGKGDVAEAALVHPARIRRKLELIVLIEIERDRKLVFTLRLFQCMDVGDDRAPGARREDVSLPAAHDRPSARIVGTDCDIARIQALIGSDGFSLKVKDAVEPRIDIPIGELHALFGFGFPIGRVAALFHFFRLQDGRAVIISDGKDGRFGLIRLTSRKCSHAQHQNKCHSDPLQLFHLIFLRK